MRILQIFLFSNFLLLACSSKPASTLLQTSDTMADKKLQFTLTYSYNERSRDSHGQADFYVIKDQEIQKRSTFRGKIRKPEEKKTIKLSPQRAEQLDELIKKLQLNQNYQKEYRVAASGVIRTYETRFSVGDYSIEVTGGVEQTKDEVANKIKDLQRMLDFLLKDQQNNFDQQFQRILDKN